MLEQTTSRERVHRRAMLRQEAKAIVSCEELELETTAAPGFHDITEEGGAVVADPGAPPVIVPLFPAHPPAATRINESEPLLLRDMARTLRQIAPSNAYYEHNDFGRRTVNMNEDECANGHSHRQHLFLSSRETIPVVNGAPALGQYQSIFVIELDRPKVRQVLVTVVGC